MTAPTEQSIRPMDDLIERLENRRMCADPMECAKGGPDPLCQKAAAELRTLRAERDAALAGVSEKCRHTSDRNRAATALKGSTNG